MTSPIPDLALMTTEELLALFKQEAGDNAQKILDMWDAAPASEKERLELEQRGMLAREISEVGYKNLYWCLTKREYPKAHYPILRGLLKAYTEQKGVMIQAWRGFGKSTDLLVWVCLLLGNKPAGSMALVRINDTKAQESGDAISTIVETSHGWKAAYPNVIPDVKAGWSKKGGFNVKDINVCGMNDENYAAWREKCFADHTSEASLVSVGIESGTLIGLHPTNGEWFDDLHDVGNTRSATEMKKVVETFEGNILPTWTDPKRPMTMAVVCTPWDSENDVYASMLRTRLLELIQIPIFDFVEEGSEGAVYFEPMNKWVKLAWKEVYTLDAVMAIYNSAESNPVIFWQMFLLDDKAAKEKAVYKLFSFPHEKIEWDWAMQGGVDPVYSDKKEGGTSHFALLYGSLTPMGNVVVSGGVLKKCSASEGMDYIIQAQNGFKNWQRCWVETYGGGVLFLQMLQQNRGLRVNPIEPKELPNKSKGDRQYTFLQPLLASGYVYISDEDTPALNALRNYIYRYPNIMDEHAPEWDVADALVALLFGYPSIRNRPVNIVSEKAWTRSQTSGRLHIDWNAWSGYGR